MAKNISYKDFFKRYGIFLLILVAIFGILIYTVLISQRAWTQNLKSSVEMVLEEKEPNTWTVEKNIKIKNSFTTSAACYEARNRKSGTLYRAVIIRVQTLYGPVPAVFLVDDDDNVYFVGYSSLHGIIESQLTNKQTSKRIEYWINKIPEIIEQ